MGLFFSKPKEPPPVPCSEKFKLFLAVHWRGVLSLILPIILLPMVLPNGELYMWVAYTLCLMGIFWVTECIPLPITSFFPTLIFPLAGVDNSRNVSKVYMNDTVMMFVTSLLLASSVEQCGLHKRLAYFAIRNIGYSHVKLLFAMCTVTTFISMWIQNTAATVMMVPIIFALLQVFEENKCLQIYIKNESGDVFASDLTVCYFCSASFSASVGGIGTIVGTATNLVFKGLFMGQYPKAPEYLSFPKFSAFSIPLMILLEICVYLSLAVKYLGLFRPNSETAKKAMITKKAQDEAKHVIETNSKALGNISFWEFMVILLFGGSMLLFFSRSPQIFTGWGDYISLHWGILPSAKLITDATLAALVVHLMLLLPRSLMFFKNFSAKNEEDLPKHSVGSVMDWVKLTCSVPFSFMFLLGGGFALSTSAKSSGLNDQIGTLMASMEALPNSVCLLVVVISVIFVTNFASNVAVCNVFGPIAMTLAVKIKQNPLWYIITAGYCASFCFMIPVGTPSNLVAQSAGKIKTNHMMVAGAGPTVGAIFISWLMFLLYAPVIWPVTDLKPVWME